MTRGRGLAIGAAGAVVLLAAVTVAAILPPRERPIDPHAVYERACAKCHEPHASSIVQSGLRDVEGRPVTSRAGRDLREFLRQGHRGAAVSAAEIDALVEQFDAMLASRFIFRKKCATCHGRAVDFARQALVLRGGKLHHRHDYKAVEDVLVYHGDVIPAEIPVLIDMLTRNLETAR
jgi:cytochrome c5